MNNSSSSLICNINKEFMIDTIMSRLDGPTLAASAAACSDLRCAASDLNLWKNLCTATWPSTANFAAHTTKKNFQNLYANAFPLIMCKPAERNIANSTATDASSSDLVSFIDLYYKGECILSKVLDVIPDPTNDDENIQNGNNNDISDELRQWFLDCPFRVDLLPSYDDNDYIPVDDNDTDIISPRCGASNSDSITYLHSLTTSTENGKRGIDLRDELADDIRLSWILFDKKNGKAVNISSWKPMSVQKSWVPDGEYVFHFGSIVPVSDSSFLSDKFAECKIVARLQLINNSGYAKWTEISMRVEDMAGAHLNTTKSIGVLNQALHTKRSRKHFEVEKANTDYKMYKREMKRRHDRREYLVDKLYALAALTVFTTLTYGCTTLFQ